MTRNSDCTLHSPTFNGHLRPSIYAFTNALDTEQLTWCFHMAGVVNKTNHR